MDAVDQAVEQWLEMERKAAAWDALYAAVLQSNEPIAPAVVDLMNRFVQTAQTPSCS